MNHLPLRKGHFDWNDQQNRLEFISQEKTPDGTNRNSKRSVYAVKHQIKHVDRTTMNKSNMGLLTSANTAFTQNKAQAKGSPKVSIPQYTDNSVVTLHHVKSVALDLLTHEAKMSRIPVSISFKQLLQTQQYNNFLFMLLKYFKCFFEELEQKRRPQKSSYLQPSKAEIQELAKTREKMLTTKKQLGQAYCVLLLGLGLEKQHHMECGKQRVSSTHRDKKMFEDLYNFCTQLIWITFRRHDFELIQIEVGNMLRSPIYNPALRQKQSNIQEEDCAFSTHKGNDHSNKPIAERVQELLSVKLPEFKKVTPAEHQRKHGKRPAMMKAIYQRSTALISLLPLPYEESKYLFMPMPQQQAKVNARMKTEDPFHIMEGCNYDEKIGIIGERMDLFNSENLLPKNMDNGDELENSEEDGVMNSHGKNMAAGKFDLRNTPSRATTEEGD